MTRKDPLRVLDAIYRFDGDETAWLEAVVTATLPYELGAGTGGYVMSLGARPGVRAIATANFCAPVDAIVRCAAQIHALSPALMRRMHAPTLLASSGEFTLRAARASGVPWEPIRDRLAAERLPMPPLWGVIGGDAGRETAMLWLGAHPRRAPTRGDRRALNLIGAHLGAALRLRALTRVPSADGATTQAVLAPDGRVLELRGDEPEAARPLLVDAVRRWDRARTRRVAPDEALSLWTALVDGRWSIVETVERDGKRLVLACRNEPRTARLRRLTARERSVAAYVALGHPYKYVGYELGLAEPTVAQVVQTVLRKLGLKSRTELIAVFGAGAPSPR